MLHPEEGVKARRVPKVFFVGMGELKEMMEKR